MRRALGEPRRDWQARVESQGLVYHTPLGVPYWDESAHYVFKRGEIDVLEAATAELQRICLDAAQHVIDHDRFAEFGIPPNVVAAIKQSWDTEPPSIHGRFDLAYDGSGPPKLLEYNADTPTSLLEAAVVQWYWLQDVSPNDDQWNSIHERLVEKWRELKEYLWAPVYFAHVDAREHEDLMTVTYLRDTASEAGLGTLGIAMSEIGADDGRGEFVDLAGSRIASIFKLYPWEWMVHEAFGQRMLESLERQQIQVIEPIWKMLWSNKALLAVLWELFPHHPNLLEAHLNERGSLRSFAKKPLMSREGANVTLVRDGSVVATMDGDYGDEGYVFQELAVAQIDGKYPVIGAWVVDGVPAGMGIRESDTPITGNLARFVPHRLI